MCMGVIVSMAVRVCVLVPIVRMNVIVSSVAGVIMSVMVVSMIVDRLERVDESRRNPKVLLQQVAEHCLGSKRFASFGVSMGVGVLRVGVSLLRGLDHRRLDWFE